MYAIAFVYESFIFHALTIFLNKPNFFFYCKF